MKRGLSLLIAAVIFIFPFSLSAAADQPVIRSGNPDSMKIALTFDDGPHPYKTDAVLDILARYGIRATFFVIGENVSYYPQPLKRAVALGHEIGNHTYHHARISEGCDAVTAEEMAGEAAPEAAPAAPEAIDLADLLKKDAPAEETAE